jgi:hypothetical protein
LIFWLWILIALVAIAIIAIAVTAILTASARTCFAWSIRTFCACYYTFCWTLTAIISFTATTTIAIIATAVAIVRIAATWSAWSSLHLWCW